MIDGLKIIRVIQSTDRFEAYEASYKGRKVFAKVAKADKPRELLARVPLNSATANRIGGKIGFKFRTPEIYAHDTDWLVTEWVDGESLGAEVDKNIPFVADILTKFLIVFDHEPVVNSRVRGTFTADSLAAYMEKNLPKSLSAEQLRVLAESKRLFDQLQPTLTPAWQDGDIKPDHIFKDPKNLGGFVLIDPEHIDQKWPRFYSLANNYVKYWVRRPQELSVELVRLFLEQSGASEQEVFKPLLANIIVRCISLHWEPDYDPGADGYNIPRSQELLRRVVQADSLSNLL